MGRGLCCAWSCGAQLCIYGAHFALCAAYGALHASMGHGVCCAWSYGAQLWIYGAQCVLCAAYGAHLCVYGAGFVLCMELWGTAVPLWGVVCAVHHL